MKRFLLDSLLCTLFVFIFLFGLLKISDLKIFNAFDPLGKALGDMELTDIAFSQFRDTDELKVDTNVVIVNTGYLNRRQLTEQIATIIACKPRVIGTDIRFVCLHPSQDSINCPQNYDTLTNLLLGSVTSAFPNFVHAEKIEQTDSLIRALGDTDIYDSVSHSHPLVVQNSHEGFVNLETEAGHQEDLKTCRRFTPRIVVRGEEHLAFSVQMAMLYDSVKTKRFLDRGKTSEVINYRGNIIDWFGAGDLSGRYQVLDVGQSLDTTQFLPSMLKDKIVIMGFLGENLFDTSWDDKFFTPLNKVYAGRARPDMYGVVVHANIVSMILNEDYVDELPESLQYVIAFFLVFLNVMLFGWITRKIPVWFDSLSLTIQVLQVSLLVFLMIEAFNLFSFKLNLTGALAAIALVGTSFELYTTVIKSLFKYLGEKIPWLTKRRQDVLTPESSE